MNIIRVVGGGCGVHACRTMGRVLFTEPEL